MRNYCKHARKVAPTKVTSPTIRNVTTGALRVANVTSNSATHSTAPTSTDSSMASSIATAPGTNSTLAEMMNVIESTTPNYINTTETAKTAIASIASTSTAKLKTTIISTTTSIATIQTSTSTTTSTTGATLAIFPARAAPPNSTDVRTTTTNPSSTTIQTTSLKSSSLITKTSTAKAIRPKNVTEYIGLRTMKTLSVPTPDMFELDPIDDHWVDEMFYEVNSTSNDIYSNITAAVEEVETSWAATVADTIWNGFQYLKKSLFGSDDSRDGITIVEREGYEQDYDSNWLSKLRYQNESLPDILLMNSTLEKPPKVEWDTQEMNLKNESTPLVNSPTAEPLTEFWTTGTVKTEDAENYSGDDSNVDVDIFVREGSGNIHSNNDFDLSQYKSLLRI